MGTYKDVENFMAELNYLYSQLHFIERKLSYFVSNLDEVGSNGIIDCKSVQTITRKRGN